MPTRQLWRRSLLLFAGLQVVTMAIAWGSWLEFGMSATLGIASLVIAHMLGRRQAA